LKNLENARSRPDRNSSLQLCADRKGNILPFVGGGRDGFAEPRKRRRICKRSDDRKVSLPQGGGIAIGVPHDGSIAESSCGGGEHGTQLAAPQYPERLPW